MTYYIINCRRQCVCTSTYYCYAFRQTSPSLTASLFRNKRRVCAIGSLLGLLAVFRRQTYGPRIPRSDDAFLIAIMATVKTEPGVKAEPDIKPDPEDAKLSPTAYDDDDLYEDAGDLEFYESTNPQDPANHAFLAHLPKYLFDQWAQLKEDDDITIGKVRTWTEVDKAGRQVQKLSMLVDPRHPIHQNVPKEYSLELRDPNLMNTFMFTEQDLPGFKNKSQGGPNSNIPPYLRPKPTQPKENGKPDGIRKRREPYYRKAIPKKTKLAAKFSRELNCQPVMTPETKHILQMRASDALKPKATTSVMTGTRNPAGVIHAGTAMGNDKMRGFVVSTCTVVLTDFRTDSSSVRWIRKRSRRSRTKSAPHVWRYTTFAMPSLRATTSTSTGL